MPDPLTMAAIFGGSQLLGGVFSSLFGDDDPNVSFQSSPEQKQILDQILPLITKLSEFGQGTGGVPYNIPDPQSLLPSAGFLDRLDPNIRQGLFEPFEQGLDIIEGRLSGRGQLGNARAGISGAAADVFGKFGQQFLPQVAQSAFQTTQPALQQGFNALLQREQAPFNLVSQASSFLPTGLIQPQQQNPLSSGLSAFSNFYALNSLLG